MKTSTRTMGTGVLTHFLVKVLMKASIQYHTTHLFPVTLSGVRPRQGQGMHHKSVQKLSKGKMMSNSNLAFGPPSVSRVYLTNVSVSYINTE